MIRCDGDGALLEHAGKCGCGCLLLCILQSSVKYCTSFTLVSMQAEHALAHDEALSFEDDMWPSSLNSCIYLGCGPAIWQANDVKLLRTSLR